MVDEHVREVEFESTVLTVEPSLLSLCGGDGAILDGRRCMYYWCTGGSCAHEIARHSAVDAVD